MIKILYKKYIWILTGFICIFNFLSYAGNKGVITHPLSGWLDGCEQSQGLPV
jgi:hypothetical protein